MNDADRNNTSHRLKVWRAMRALKTGAPKLVQQMLPLAEEDQTRLVAELEGLLVAKGPAPWEGEDA